MADLGAGSIFGAINTAFRFSEFVIALSEVGTENHVFVRTIQRVRYDLEETERLMGVPTLKATLESNPSKLYWIRNAIFSTKCALNDIGLYVERVRADKDRDGTISFAHRVRWVLKDHGMLENRRSELAACHQTLTTVLNTLHQLEIMGSFGPVMSPQQESMPPPTYESSLIGDGDFLGPWSRKPKKKIIPPEITNPSLCQDAKPPQATTPEPTNNNNVIGPPTPDPPVAAYNDIQPTYEPVLPVAPSVAPPQPSITSVPSPQPQFYQVQDLNTKPLPQVPFVEDPPPRVRPQIYQVQDPPRPQTHVQPAEVPFPQMQPVEVYTVQVQTPKIPANPQRMSFSSFSNLGSVDPWDYHELDNDGEIAPTAELDSSNTELPPQAGPDRPSSTVSTLSTDDYQNFISRQNSGKDASHLRRTSSQSTFVSMMTIPSRSSTPLPPVAEMESMQIVSELPGQAPPQRRAHAYSESAVELPGQSRDRHSQHRASFQYTGPATEMQGESAPVRRTQTQPIRRPNTNPSAHPLPPSFSYHSPVPASVIENQYDPYNPPQQSNQTQQQTSSQSPNQYTTYNPPTPQPQQQPQTQPQGQNQYAPYQSSPSPVPSPNTMTSNGSNHAQPQNSTQPQYTSYQPSNAPSTRPTMQHNATFPMVQQQPQAETRRQSYQGPYQPPHSPIPYISNTHPTTRPLSHAASFANFTQQQPQNQHPTPLSPQRPPKILQSQPQQAPPQQQYQNSAPYPHTIQVQTQGIPMPSVAPYLSPRDASSAAFHLNTGLNAAHQLNRDLASARGLGTDRSVSRGMNVETAMAVPSPNGGGLGRTAVSQSRRRRAAMELALGM